MINATMIGRKRLKRWINQQANLVEKDLNTSIRVEGYRLMRQLQREIRAGAPGGKRFVPLSYISRGIVQPAKNMDSDLLVMKRVKGRLRLNKPLRTLAIGVRYNVSRKKPFAMQIGWVGPTEVGEARKNKRQGLKRGSGEYKMSSKSWQRLAKMHQGGFTSSISPAFRKLLINKGSRMKGVSRPHYFLRKTTTQLTTPARPIMDPFWDAHRGEAFRNIKENYKRKRRGERI